MRCFYLMVLVLVPSLAHAQPKAIDKVAYVDMARVLNEVGEGKAAIKRLEKDFEKKQKQLDKLKAGWETKRQDFEKKRGTMKADALEKRQQELQQELLKMQQAYMTMQQELVDERSRVTQTIAGKVRKVIARIGDRDGFDLVLNIADTVLFYKRHLEITDQVVKEYNQQYGKK